jgi:hypothetical protein
MNELIGDCVTLTHTVLPPKPPQENNISTNTINLFHRSPHLYPTAIWGCADPACWLARPPRSPNEKPRPPIRRSSASCTGWLRSSLRSARASHQISCKCGDRESINVKDRISVERKMSGFCCCGVGSSVSPLSPSFLPPLPSAVFMLLHAP